MTGVLFKMRPAVNARPAQYSVRLFFSLFGFLFAADYLLASALPDSLPPYTSRHWQTGEDPSRNAIQAIAQTPDGFLWLGTQDGIARFDGDQFDFFPIPGEKNPQRQRVNALYADADGSLWVATPQGIFHFQHGAWTSCDRPQGGDEVILCITRTRDHVLWVGTRAGLWFQKDGKFILAGDTNAPVTNVQRFPAIHAVRSMLEETNGDLLVPVPDKLLSIHHGLVATNYDLSPFQPDLMRSMCRGRDGAIWIGAASGLIRFKDNQFAQFTKADGLPDNSGLTAVHEDRRGNLWVGTFGGLCRFANGKFHIERTAEGEPYDQIICFFEDRENNFWVGAKDGLHQLRAQQFSTVTMRNGLAHNNVISVFEDNEEAMWIGTWGGGLHRVKDGKITLYSTANTPGMKKDWVLGICGASEGGIWFGEDYDGGLYHFKDGRLKRFGSEIGIVRNAIRTVLEVRDGRVFFGMATGGLNVLSGGRLASHYDSQTGLPINAVRAILQTHDGQIWVGTEAGLCQWMEGKFRTLTTRDGLSDNTIYALLADKEQIWIGTTRGLNRFRDGKFTAYTTAQGLSDDLVLEMVEDDFANLWMCCRRGVFRVSKSDLDAFDAGRLKKIPSVLFGKADGMNSQVCVSVAKPSAYKTKDGRLWFATTKGLAVTDPKLKIEKNEKPPPVVIEQLIVDKEKFEVQQTADSSTANFKLQTLNLPPGRGELEVHYAALSYTAPEKNRFKYKLEGIDTDWVDAGARRTAFYNNLPPGRYTFRVIGSNNDGVWNKEGASFALIFQPHFWQTLWFKMLCAVAGMSLAAAGARYFTKKRMQAKLQRLEQQHAIERERARIAKDIHDDLGASLTRITFLGELAETDRDRPDAVSGYMQRIVAAARDTVRGLDEIVWAVNPKNDTLDSLMEYIAQYVHEFFQNTPVRCRLDLPDEVPQIPLSSEMRHSLFLVVKEALNNTLKHADATSVCVRASLSNGDFRIELSDNGRGFDLGSLSAKSLGNGLGNMRDRIEKAGGKYEIQSAKGQGTQISLVVPLTRIQNN